MFAAAKAMAVAAVNLLTDSSALARAAAEFHGQTSHWAITAINPCPFLASR